MYDVSDGTMIPSYGKPSPTIVNGVALLGFVFRSGVFRGFAPTAIRCHPYGTDETMPGPDEAMQLQKKQTRDFDGVTR
jgi:hypothetical protein